MQDVRPTDLQLDDITFEKDYPSYKSAKRANNLLERILKEDDPTEFTPEEKKSHFLMPGIYMENPKMDTSMYSAAAILSTLLVATKQLYRKNGVEFPEDDFSIDDRLTGIMPEVGMIDVMNSKGYGFEERPDILSKGVVEQFIEAIETEFNFALTYDSRKSNPDFERDIDESVESIAKYASFAIDAARVMEGFGMPAEAGAVKAVMKRLSHKKRVAKALKGDNGVRYFDELINVHAQINGVKYGGDPFPFIDSIGREITGAINITKNYFLTHSFLTEFALSKENKIVFETDGKLGFASGGRDIRKSWNDDWRDTISEFMRHDEFFEDVYMTTSKSPFLFLDEKLHAFGMPYTLAKNVVEYMSYNQFPQTISSHQKTMSPNKVLSNLRNREGNYAKALHDFVQSVTGMTKRRITYTFFENNHHLANSIGTSTTVSKGNEILFDRWSRLSPDRELELAEKQFAEDGLDIYTGINMGVCWLLDSNPIGDFVNSERGFIESRYSADGIEDEVARTLIHLRTDFHEVVHAGQIGSRIKWRYFANAVSSFFCDIAIKHIQDGTYDLELGYQTAESLFSEGKTRKGALLDAFDMYTMQALAKGKEGENLRDKGVMTGLWRSGIELIENHEISREALDDILERSEFDECEATQYVKEVREALIVGDVSRLEELELKTKHAAEDQSGVLETMADTYGMLILEEYMDKGLIDLSQERRDAMYEAIWDSATWRGKFSKMYANIVDTSSSVEERDSKLRELGMKYQKGIDKGDHIVKVEERLIELGYNPLNPCEAYDNMNELEKRVEGSEHAMDDVLMPFNSSLAAIGLRYNTHMNEFKSVIDKYGKKEAFQIMLNAEKMSDILDKA